MPPPRYRCRAARRTPARYLNPMVSGRPMARRRTGRPRSRLSWWTLTREASVNSTRASVTSARDRMVEEWGFTSTRCTGPWVTASPEDHECEGGTDRPPFEPAGDHRPGHHAGGHHGQNEHVQSVLHRVLLLVRPRRPVVGTRDSEVLVARPRVCLLARSPACTRSRRQASDQPGEPPSAMPMIGSASAIDPVEPSKTAPRPNVKMPPSAATR